MTPDGSGATSTPTQGSRVADCAASPQQMRLARLGALAAGGHPFVARCTLRLETDASAAELESALLCLVERHEVLRTSFLTASEAVVQRVHPFDPGTALDWGQGTVPPSPDPRQLPTLRARLEIDGGARRLHLALPALAADALSLLLLAAELTAELQGPALGAEPRNGDVMQYGDVAAAFLELIESDEMAEGREYWQHVLAAQGAGDGRLSFANRPLADGGFRPRRYPLGAAAGRALAACAEADAETPMALCLAAWSALLARREGLSTVPIGVLSDGRSYAELATSIGPYARLLPVTFHVEPAADLAAGAGLAARALEGALGWQDLYAEPEASSQAVGFAWLPSVPLPGVGVEEASVVDDRFLVRLEGRERVGGGLDLALLYDAARCEKADAVALGEQLTALLAAAERRPGTALGELPILGEVQRRRVSVDFVGPPTPLPDACLHSLVAERGLATPDALAVLGDAGSLTCAELSASARRLARQLRDLGAGRGTVVAVAIERSPELIVALLAVLQSGAAYLPLDPAYPKRRLGLMLDDSRASLALVSGTVPEALADRDLTVVDLAGIELSGSPAPSDGVGGENAPPVGEVTPDDLAYVIYTSGSTGRPKGVMMRHRSILNRLQWTIRRHGITSGDRVLQKTPVSFDASIWEVFVPLLVGAPVVLARPGGEGDAVYLGTAVERHRITVLQLVPSMLDVVLGEPAVAGWRSLRAMFCGGERFPLALAERFAERVPHAEVHNLYGPTEAAIDVASWACRRDEPRRELPLGPPIDNTCLRVLGEGLEPQPIGFAGELFIGGVNLARGYLRRPALTAERFVPDPYGAPGTRLYRSGDLTRWRGDGSLEFLGRADQQVKLRGVRIELGDVESQLRRHPAVATAIVEVRGEGADARLTAYVVPERAASALDESRLLEEWQAVFEETYRQPGGDADFDVSGWNSSYTGLPIPPEEMRHWVDSTVDRIRALAPRRVWEIGCGTGLLLLRIATHVEHYLGTDLSSTVVARLAEHVRERGADLAGVELAQRRADDFSAIEPGRFDVVVLSSVVQYFPDVHYLLRVLEGAVAAVRPGGAVFVGDVRSLPLLEAFHASVELYKAPPALPRERLLLRARRARSEDGELVVAPDLFHALAQRWERVSGVRISLKRGRDDNELARYRYDVVIEVGERPAGDGGLVDLDWRRDGLDLRLLRRYLQTSPAALRVTGIPNRRLARDVRLVSMLQSTSGPETVDELRTELRRVRGSGVEPEALWELSTEAGYAADVTWSGSGELGAVDALFVPAAAGNRAWPPRPASGEASDWDRLTNDPAFGRASRDLVTALPAFLRDRLPAPMVPTDYVLLDALPRLPSGKVDRRALPPPERVGTAIEDTEAPRTPVEEILCGLYTDLLDAPVSTIDADFFALGGHSLLATQLLSRLRTSLGVEVPLRAVFQSPTVRALAEQVEAALRSGEGLELPPIEPVARGGDLPLSYPQQRLWLVDQLHPGDTAYSVAFAVELTGSLDVPALGVTFDRLVERHEVLRTTFRLAGDRPVQVIHPRRLGGLPLVDLGALPAARREAEAHRLAHADRQRPFDLSTGPLFRSTLLHLDEGRHVVLLTLHHIISDGWSTGILIRDVGALYRATVNRGEPELPPLTVQYADFAAWQQRWMAGEVLEAELDFWRRYLAGLPAALRLPGHKPAVETAGSVGARLARNLGRRLTQALVELSASEGATLSMTLLAALKALLFRYSGQTDLVVGAVMGNRSHLETEGLIGFFVNLLLLRTDLNDGPTFRGLLGRVRETTLKAYAHQDLPFEKLVEELAPQRSRHGTPLIEILFVFQNVPRQRLELPGLTVTMLEHAWVTERFDLRLVAAETSDGVELTWSYKPDAYDAAAIERAAHHFEALLTSAVEDPEAPIGTLDYLTTAEKKQQATRKNKKKDKMERFLSVAR